MLSTMMHPLNMHPLDMMMTAMARCPRVTASRGARPRLEDHDSKYTLTLFLPGVSAKDIKVSATDGMLKLEVESHTSAMAWRQRLPRDTDVDTATASHVDGVLMVTLPKK